jgi:hypothetical protein
MLRTVDTDGLIGAHGYRFPQGFRSSLRRKGAHRDLDVFHGLFYPYCFLDCKLIEKIDDIFIFNFETFLIGAYNYPCFRIGNLFYKYQNIRVFKPP